MTIEAEASRSAAPSAAPSPAPAPAAPAPAPAPSVPPTTTKSTDAATANASTQAAPQDTAGVPQGRAVDVAGTDDVLDDAGYPLTPGVSSLVIKPDFVFSGYLQAQYEAHQDSVDQVRQGGVLLNQNRFVLRRGRFRVTRDWEWAQIIVEIDGNSTKGPNVRFQKAEASLIYGRSKDKDQPPLAQFTMGIFDTPFGFEVPYSPKYRFFMERSQVTRALWPGEPDVGARLSGGIGFVRYSMAVTNGEVLDEKSAFQLQDPNSNKDFTGRLGAESKPSRSLVIAGGISYNRGKGFHPGQDATKNSLSFTDNGTGKITTINQVGGNVAQAATPSKTFDRWAVGADLEFLLKTTLGWSMLYAEIIGAENLDRGLYVADPLATTAGDVREFGYYVAFTQEITRYGVVGFRYDYYDPNSDLLDSRRGKLVPYSQQIRTYSPLFGLVLPGRARLLFQYDVIKDFLARDNRGVPTDFKNNQWTLRLQVNL